MTQRRQLMICFFKIISVFQESEKFIGFEKEITLPVDYDQQMFLKCFMKFFIMQIFHK